MLGGGNWGKVGTGEAAPHLGLRGVGETASGCGRGNEELGRGQGELSCASGTLCHCAQPDPPHSDGNCTLAPYNLLPGLQAGGPSQGLCSSPGPGPLTYQVMFWKQKEGGWSSCGWEGLAQPCLRPGARSCLPGAENQPLPEPGVWAGGASKEEKKKGGRGQDP